VLCCVVVRCKLQHNTTKLEIAGLLDIRPQQSSQREENSLAFAITAIAYLSLVISATNDECPDGHAMMINSVAIIMVSIAAVSRNTFLFW
jgi:hypothetical protein